MFNIGPGELAIILVAALIFLGPKRLPELARTLGKFMREFRRQTDDVKNLVEREFYKMDEQLSLETPLQNPTPALPPPGAVPRPPVIDPGHDEFGRLLPTAANGEPAKGSAVPATGVEPAAKVEAAPPPVTAPEPKTGES